MKYICLMIVCVFFGIYNVSAQLPPATSISQQTSLGKYNAEKSAENVIGSMFLFDDAWKKADLKSKDGSEFKGYKIKYDVVNDVLIYQGHSNDDMMVFLVPIHTFAISENDSEGAIFKNGYKNIDKNTANTYYEVLNEGKTQLLKKVTKTIIEAHNYNSPSVVKNIDTQTKYYFVNAAGEIVPVKNNKKDVLSLFKDRLVKINEYISNNKIDYKNDTNLAAVFKFYDSLL